MKRWIKYGVIGIAALAVLAGAALALGSVMADRKMQRRIEVAGLPVALKSDATSIERGRYLFASRGCVDCHGANGGGRTFHDDGKGFVIAGPNISPGPGSVTAAYKP